jgi:hypothetical protein
MLLGVECSLMHLLSSLNSIHFFQNAEVLTFKFRIKFRMATEF